MLSRINGSACGSALAGDANGDGCVDIVDLQATLAARGRLMTGASGTGANVATGVQPAAASVNGNFTFTVTSTADTPDAASAPPPGRRRYLRRRQWQVHPAGRDDGVQLGRR